MTIPAGYESHGEWTGPLTVSTIGACLFVLIFYAFRNQSDTLKHAKSE